MSVKSTKRLKKGFLEKANAGKRVRNLLAFAESETQEEVVQAFAEHHQLISSVVAERFAEFESAPKAVRKGKHHVADVLTLYQLLLHFVANTLESHPKYADDVETWLKKSLGSGNKQALRMQGFHLLLRTLAILHAKGQQEDERFLPLLAASIDLRPFYPDDRSPPSSTAFAGQVLAPELSPAADGGAGEMWAALLEEVGGEGQRFCFWFGVLQRLFFPLLLPAASQRMGVEPHAALQPLEARSFALCPPALLCSLLDSVGAWLQLPPASPVVRTLWAPPHGDLLMELCRQAALLPLPHASVAERCIEQFRLILLEKLPKTPELLEPLGEQTLQEYYRSFVRSVSRVFFLEQGPTSLEEHVRLGRKALAVYLQLAVELSYSMEQQTWVTLQETTLALATELMASATPFALNHISTTLAEEIFNVLFVVWIRSPHTTPEMWAELSQRLSKLVQWHALLVQWKEKVVQLTYVLRELFYGVELRTKQAAKKRSTRPQAASQAVSVFDVDPNISSVNWDQESVRRMWHTLLHVLGDLTAIVSPENFATAISCCGAVVDLVFAAEDELPLAPVPALPVYEEFIAVLLGACCVEERRNRGRLVAYSTLCRIFTRPHFTRVASFALLCHFYRVLKAGLSSGHASLVWSILRNAPALFSLGMPGANILIPDFVRETSNLLKSDGKAVPADVQRRAVAMLASLLCYPGHYGALAYRSGVGEEQFITYDQLREKISTTLLMALHNAALAPANVAFTVRALVVLVLDELAGEAARRATVRACVKAVLGACSSEEDDVALAALEGLACLASVFEAIAQLDKSLVALIMYSLSEYIVARITAPPRVQEEQAPAEEEEEDGDPWNLEAASSGPSVHRVAVAHFHCLLDWVMATNTSQGLDVDRSGLLEKVFESVAVGLFGEEVSLQRATQQTLFQSHKSDASGSQAKRRTRFGLEKLQRASSSSGREHAASLRKGESLLERLATEHPNVAEEVREAAERFVATALASYSNHPRPEGATDGPPVQPEEEEEATLHFVYNSHSLLSISSTHASCRVVVRDGTGKSTWDARVLPNAEACDFYERVAAEQQREDERVAQAAARARAGSRQAPAQERDCARAMVQQLARLQPHLAFSGTSFLAAQAEKLEHFRAQVLALQSGEEQAQASGLCARTFPLLSPAQAPASPFHAGRLLLSHQGFLRDLQLSSFQSLPCELRLRRSLKELDKINPRETIKVGLIYVRAGQELQNDILANDKGSKRFTEFVESLGWSVDMNSHAAYRGGLDARSTGRSSPYYASAQTELIFHDVTRMPTAPDDPQQICKKRHVGNDNVQIVWSEHHRDYRPSTITSQFNHAHIVVYPLPDGLHRIQVFKKEEIPPFGPLQSGMVVTKRNLGLLVRQTAMSANTASRTTTGMYRKPFHARCDFIREVVKRYAVDQPLPDVMASVFLDTAPKDDAQ